MPEMSDAHRRAIVIDAHCDSLLNVLGLEAEAYPGMPMGKRDFLQKNATGQVDLVRLQEGGVTCQVLALYIEPQYKPTRSTRRALEMLDCFYDILSRTNRFSLATRSADIRQAKQEGKVCGLLSIEGGEAVEGRLSVLRMFYKLGVRAMGLTWNQRNDIADGQGETSAHSGLTDFGTSLVKEMERLGMLVDVSHISDSGFWSVDSVAERPYIASHSNCRALASSPRNLTDKQLEAMARKGGVAGVVFSPSFVDANPTRVSLSRLCDHIDHIRKVAGIDHVGIGSDFDGFPVPEGSGIVIKDASEYPLLSQELAGRGYSDEDIAKVIGGNWLRLYDSVLG